MFGGRGGPARLRARSPAPTRRPSSTLTVEEAYRGGRRTITLSGPDGPRTLEVTIPAGVTDGQRIRLAGQGGRGSGGAAAGDLYLVVRIAPHPRYRVEGRDIYVDLPLGAVGGGARRDRSRSTRPGGEAKVKVPPGHVERPAAAAARDGPAQPARHARATCTPRSGSWCRPSSTDEERRLFEELGRGLHLRPEEAPMSTR